MEYQKIINLLDNTQNEESKFRTRNCVEINDELKGTYSPSKHLLVFKTSWRRLQYVFSVTMFCLARHFEDVLSMSWIRLEDVLEDEKLLLWWRLEDISWRRLEEVVEKSTMFTGDACI